MKPVFDETLLESHDFYHARYGRSALIVAVQRDTGEEQSRQQARWQLFDQQGRGNSNIRFGVEPLGLNLSSTETMP